MGKQERTSNGWKGNQNNNAHFDFQRVAYPAYIAGTQALTVRPAGYISNTCLHLPKAPRTRIHHTAGCVRGTNHRKQGNEAPNCHRVPGKYLHTNSKVDTRFWGGKCPTTISTFIRKRCVPALRYGGMEDVTSSYYTHDTQLSSPHRTL